MALDQETKDFRTGLVVLDRIQRVPGTLASNRGRMQGSYSKWSEKWLKTSKYIIEIANQLIVATLKYLQLFMKGIFMKSSFLIFVLKRWFQMDFDLQHQHFLGLPNGFLEAKLAEVEVDPQYYSLLASTVCGKETG